MDFLFLPVPKKKMGFLFQNKCRNILHTSGCLQTNCPASIHFVNCARKTELKMKVWKKNPFVSDIWVFSAKNNKLRSIFCTCVYENPSDWAESLFSSRTHNFSFSQI